MMTIEELTERINNRGIKVNISALQEEYNSISEDVKFTLLELSKRVASALNMPLSKVKINSSKLMADFFYGYHQLPVTTLTRSGSRALDAATLSPYASSNADVKDYIFYRSESKRAHILKNLLSEVEFGDEIHTNFNCHGAISGRFTSTSPNLQQIPPMYRKFFIPRKGFKFLCCDIHQAEPSLSYQLAGLIPPVDVHENTARNLGISRAKAKVFNNGVAYGMTPYGIAKLLGCTKSQGEQYLNAWRGANAELVSFIDKINLKAAEEGKISIYDGSLTVKDDFSVTEKGYMNSRAFNIFNQGSLAKLMKIAMVNIQSFLDEHSPNSHIVLTEHDELVIELSEKDLNLAPTLIGMLEHIDKFEFIVDSKIADCWVK